MSACPILGLQPAYAGLHPNPLPLTMQDGIVKVALARAAKAGHNPHAESLAHENP
jgi:hypothetical protein